MKRLRDHAGDWPWRYRAVKRLHTVVNRLAWRYAPPRLPDGTVAPPWGRAKFIDRSHPLWRLNDWLATKWVPWWIRHG